MEIISEKEARERIARRIKKYLLKIGVELKSPIDVYLNMKKDPHHTTWVPKEKK